MMKFINEKTNPSVWILWGSKAKALKSKIDQNKHYIVVGGHPSSITQGACREVLLPELFLLC